MEDKKDFIEPFADVKEASGVKPNSFIAEWKAFPSAEYYLLDVALDTAFTEKVEDIYPVSVKELTYKVDNLKPNTLYYYRVGVKTTSGTNIKYSETQQVSTIQLPSPVAFDPLSTNTNELNLAWSSVEEAEGYKLEISSHIDFVEVDKVYLIQGAKDTTYLVDNLDAKEAYFYRVSAFQGEHFSLPSNIRYAATTQLKKPEGLNVADSSYTTILLNWEKVISAESYEVELSLDPLFTNNASTFYQVENTSLPSISLSDLDANTIYYVRVRAKEASLFSVYSSTLKIKTKSLAAPLALQASEIGSRTFKVSWNEVTEAEGYILELATDREFKNKVNSYAYVNTLELIYLFTNLQANTDYYFRIRTQAYNSLSQYSDTLTIRTENLSAPSSVDIVDRKLTSFTLSWGLVEGAESYLLSIAQDSTFSNFLEGYREKEIIDNQWTLTGLDPFEKYYIIIKSKNGEVVSQEKLLTYVGAAIPNACMLSYRAWEDGLEEHYIYENRLLVGIEGSRNGVLAYSWELLYQGEKLVEAKKHTGSGTLSLSEVWTFGYTEDSWISLEREDESKNTLEYIALAYDDEGRVSKIEKFEETNATSPLSEENYTYISSHEVEARNAEGELIKKWKYTEYINPTIKFTPQVNALLYDLVGNTLIGKAPLYTLGLYQESDGYAWNKHAYVYDTNDLGVPVKVYPGDESPTQTFHFQSCGF
ncbi:fibronectin type III domain-containing protein [Porifericola rhodea]|uniref:fibronectin type III domain-containing protein n=1 Tax=Porifericola rhodea TaxID=930972 RepID=UPI0026655B5C|nr:fibronectin type III domain-containing protein [Porifericola rhodea]WKN32680.1 fibronectin type III domain-containing protein [Porifericola rhodea]